MAEGETEALITATQYQALNTECSIPSTIRSSPFALRIFAHFALKDLVR